MSTENRAERLRAAVEENANTMMETGNIIYVNNTRYFAESNGVVMTWNGFGNCATVGRIIGGKFVANDHSN